MRTRFSVSAKCAFSCASCACRCAYCRALLLLDVEPVEVEREEEGRDREAEAVPAEPDVEPVDCVGRDISLFCYVEGGLFQKQIRVRTCARCSWM